MTQCMTSMPSTNIAQPDQAGERALHSFTLVWVPLIAILITLYVPFVIDYGWRYRAIPNVDLPSFYAASASVFRYGESPYDPARLPLSMTDNRRVYPYLYPPPSLLLFFPLSTMTYDAAQTAVLVANHLLYLVIVLAAAWVIAQQPIGGRLVRAALTIVYLLTFYPTVVTLNHGQVNILLLLFLLLFWLFTRVSQPVLSGLFLALAVLLKTYPILLVPLLVLVRRWRESVYALAWVGVTTLVAVAVLPSAVWQDWASHVLPSGGYGRTPVGLFSPASIWNQSLNGFFARYVGESSSTSAAVTPAAAAMTYGASAIVALGSALAAWRSRTFDDSLERTLLVALPTMFLIAPFSWDHHIVYLLPSILLILNSQPSTRVGVAFFALCVPMAAMLAMRSVIQFKFFVVVGFWLVGMFLAGSNAIQLPTRNASWWRSAPVRSQAPAS